MHARVLAVLAVALAAAGAGCERSNAATSVDAGDAADAHAKDASAEGGAAASAADAGPAVDDTALPSTTNDELDGRMRHLLEALAQDNADLAGDVLFPRDAFLASKDLEDPQKVWEKTISGAFKKAVDRTHSKTKGVEQARFTGFELGHGPVQVTPKHHDFKKPLWRVRHSKLSFTIDGKQHHILIAEMTAWRGAWYVTRLR